MAMKIHFMWVGQGDCTIIETNAGQVDGKIIMIDCGSTSGNRRVYYNNIEPALVNIFADYPLAKRGIIDYLFLTHSDGDHINMIGSLLESDIIREVTHFYYGGNISGYDDEILEYHEAEEDKEAEWIIDGKIINVHDLESCYIGVPGTTEQSLVIDIPPPLGFKLWILSANYPFKRDPRINVSTFNQKINQKKNLTGAWGRNKRYLKNSIDNNGNSIVILVEYDTRLRAMLLGDATKHQQKAILDDFKASHYMANGRANIFKMTHHGSYSDFNYNFANELVRPTMVLCSASIKEHKHPSMKAIDSINTLDNEYDNSPVHWSTFCEDLEYVNEMKKKRAQRDNNVKARYDYYQHQDPIYVTLLSFRPEPTIPPPPPLPPLTGATAPLVTLGKRSTKVENNSNTELHGINWVLTANSATDYGFNHYEEALNEALKLTATGSMEFSAKKRKNKRRY